MAKSFGRRLARVGFVLGLMGLINVAGEESSSPRYLTPESDWEKQLRYKDTLNPPMDEALDERLGDMFNNLALSPTQKDAFNAFLKTLGESPQNMAEKKLYLPSELELISFRKHGEDNITVEEVYDRALKLHALTGEDQFEFLWEHREEFPKEWRISGSGVFGWTCNEFLIPDSSNCYAIRWQEYYQEWARYKGGYQYSFCSPLRLFRPRGN